MSLTGLTVPVPTIFDAHGAIDAPANGRYARGMAEAGIDHLFVLGSLGEFPSVRPEERAPILSAVRDALRPPTDLWVGCGAPSTIQAVGFAREAQAAGAAVLLAVPPYYLHPTPAAIAEYYRSLRRAVDRPLFAYNIPSLVGYPLAPGLLHALGREGVLQGVKDTSGSFPSVRAFLDGRPAGFAVIPGDDAFATEAILAGAEGAIMGLANILPRLGVALVRAAAGRDEPRARALQASVDRLGAIVREGPFPSTGKFLAARLRGAEAGYRSPYDPLTPEEERRVLAALAPHEAELRRFV